MQPDEIVKVLQQRGWIAKVLKQSDFVVHHVKVTKTGLFKCVDGRESDKNEMDGPKTLGGVYALVAARKDLSREGLEAAVSEVREKGYAPSIHGDEAHGGMGCGFFKLWRTGRLTGLDRPEYTAHEGRETVAAAGGEYETLKGGHSESCAIINLVEGTTYEPQTDQSFVVDAWVASVFDLDVGVYLTLAAETVEKLNGPMVAKIIVPG